MTAFNPGGTGAPLGQGPSEFSPILYTDADLEASALKPIGQLELYWRRFRTHRLALVGLGVITLLVLMAIFAPLITPGQTATTQHVTGPEALPFGAGNPPTLANFPWRLFGTTSSTDDLQRSVLAEVTYGARISLFIGFVGALLTSALGTIVGAISGYFGGWIDNLMMRITDVFLALPFLPLVIAISSFYQTTGDNTFLIIGILVVVSWPASARLVRSLYLTLRESEFVEAARAVGVNQWRIIFRHVLPNALSPIVVVTTLNVAVFIILEATLDFLGLGIHFPPTASWGNTLTASQGVIPLGIWWWPLFPGMFLVITVLAINFVGDGLRDALDVRSRVE